ncbi:MAG: hypothetical protein QM765_26440 [Myxococcales bacterium]
MRERARLLALPIGVCACWLLACDPLYDGAGTGMLCEQAQRLTVAVQEKTGPCPRRTFDLESWLGCPTGHTYCSTAKLQAYREGLNCFEELDDCRAESQSAWDAQFTKCLADVSYAASLATTCPGAGAAQ